MLVQCIKSVSCLEGRSGASRWELWCAGGMYVQSAFCSDSRSSSGTPKTRLQSRRFVLSLQMQMEKYVFLFSVATQLGEILFLSESWSSKCHLKIASVRLTYFPLASRKVLHSLVPPGLHYRIQDPDSMEVLRLCFYNARHLRGNGDMGC